MPRGCHARDGEGRPVAGGVHDRGAPGEREGWARNIPLPTGATDTELAYVREAAILPLLDAWEPEAVVVQGGTDAVADDPLAGLAMSNTALWAVIAAVARQAPRLLVLGGGGYNPWSVGRGWAGVWGVLTGAAIPDRLPPAAEAVLRELTWRHSWARAAPDRWFTALADPPCEGPVREAVRAAVRTALDQLPPIG